MRNIAFLSMDNLDGFISDDELAIPHLKNYDINVETVSWRQENNWDKYETVIIRTTWDYQNDPGKFINVLGKINSSKANLQNNIELIKWNIDKKYLIELEEKNNKIVPTIWEEKMEHPSRINFKKIKNYFTNFNTNEIVIKPTVSANADNTFRIKQNELSSYKNELLKIFKQRSFMVQPFLKNIIEEGEYSLFYFGNVYSHTILKKPKQNDFRVQEEHGGIITAINPDEELIKIGNKVINSLKSLPLYSRLDLVRDSNNNFLIMEVELIEPALYFRMDSLSPQRFASAVVNLLR